MHVSTPPLSAGSAAESAPPLGLLAVPGAARWLGIGRTTFYRLVSRGEIQTVQIGKRRLVAVADLEAYVARLRAGGAQ